MALTMVMSCVGTEGFSVFAENVTASETSSAAETASGSQTQPSSEAVSTQAAGEKAGSGMEETTGAEASGEDLLYSDGSKDESEGTEGNTLSGNQTPSETAESSETETTEELTTEESSEEETSTESVQETEEAAALPDGAHVPDGYTQQYTVRDEVNGFAVTVYAPEGALPEGSVLSAELLEEDDESYRIAEAALAEDAGITLSGNRAETLSENEQAVSGFAALDIHFENADGNEVEPKGDVYVVIDAQELLPDHADPDTVTVQHHAESGNGITVETVADTADVTDGTVIITEEATVQAAFEVSSFSTFTISWSSAEWPYSTYFNVTVHYVDENGNPIQNIASEDVSISDNVRVDFANYAVNINGYSYSGAHYESYNGKLIVHMDSSSESGRFETTYYLTFYSSNDSSNDGIVRRLSRSSWQWDSETADVYLVYTNTESGEEGDGGTTVTNATVTTGKTAVLREDGNYDLTLTISGTRGSETNPAMMDVLFIVDRSNSMLEDGRLGNAKNAMTTLVNSLENNNNIDAQYSIVTFSGRNTTGWSGSKNDASVYMDWIGVSGDNVSNYISRINTSGGTNYQAGLDVGTDQLGRARDGAITVVIFLSDGAPTWSYNDGYGSYNLGTSSSGWSETLTQAGKISCDYFYAVGIGASFTDYLQGLVNTVNATTKSYITAEDDGSNLTNLFEDIVADVTFFAASNVTVTDPLSEYADIVLDESEQVQFTISVTAGTNTWSNNGNSLTFKDADEKDVTVTANYNENDKTITLDFPDDYELEENYSYSVTTVITPSEDAITEGMESGEAQQTPDTGTGTHADRNEQGFWSNDNDNAKVTFTANDENGSELFPKPVIQVQEPETGNLVITKEVSGATVSNKNYSFTISTQVESVAGQSYDTSIEGTTVTFSSVPDADEYYTATVTAAATSVVDNVDGTITIMDLPIGTYTVTENTENVSINGYRFDGVSYQAGEAEGSEVTLTGAEGENATVAVTNRYTELIDIIIHKTGKDNSGLADAQFQLYYTEDGTNYYYCETTTDEGEDAVTTVSWITLSEESDAPQPTTLTSGSDGNLTFRDLDSSRTYYLVETEAPDGYQQLSSPVTISWGADGLTAYYGEEELPVSGNTITVPNVTGAILPETGGNGTALFTIGGLLLIAVAVGSGNGMRRRKLGR